MNKKRVQRLLKVAVYAALGDVHRPYSPEQRKAGACFGALWMLPTEARGGYTNDEIDEMIDETLRERDALSPVRLVQETASMQRVFARLVSYGNWVERRRFPPPERVQLRVIEGGVK
jgi:hypothetical protein